MIFISHARKDSPVIDIFVEKVLRLGFEIDSNLIFYTSHPDTDIQGGKYINGEIFKAIKDSKLLILFLSRNYFNSPYCLCEMGAAKLLQDKKSVFLFLLPGLQYSEVEGVFSENMIKKVDPEGMDSFIDSVSKSCKNIIKSKASAPARYKDEFLSMLDKKINKIEQPISVSIVEFNTIKEQVDLLKDKLIQYKEKLIHQKNYIDELEKIKNSDQIENIKNKKYKKVEEVYENLLYIAKSGLSQLSNDGKIALFYFFSYGDKHATYRINKENLNIDRDLDELFFGLGGESIYLGEKGEEVLERIKNLERFLTGDNLERLCEQYGFKKEEWEIFHKKLSKTTCYDITYWKSNLF